MASSLGRGRPTEQTPGRFARGIHVTPSIGTIPFTTEVAQCSEAYQPVGQHSRRHFAGRGAHTTPQHLCDIDHPGFPPAPATTSIHPPPTCASVRPEPRPVRPEAAPTGPLSRRRRNFCGDDSPNRPSDRRSGGQATSDAFRIAIQPRSARDPAADAVRNSPARRRTALL